MTEEPRWPEKMPVADEYDVHDGRARAYNTAIDECVAAWRASTDDPSQSPVGEVRCSPEGALYCRVAHRVDSPWVLVHGGPPPAVWHWWPDDVVKGWAVVGAVPGTPAAYLNGRAEAAAEAKP